MTSLKEDVRRSAMLCILTVPATMTSHDLMKFVASFYEVIEHMKIIRDSTPNQYMVLIKFSSQVNLRKRKGVLSPSPLAALQWVTTLGALSTGRGALPCGRLPPSIPTGPSLVPLPAGGRRQLLHDVQRPAVQLHRRGCLPAGLRGAGRSLQVRRCEFLLLWGSEAASPPSPWS